MSVCIPVISYKLLDPHRQEFRLLSVLPDEDEDSPVHCTLRHASLEVPPEYTALSYVWGDSTIHEDITMNDSTVSVTNNDILETLQALSRSVAAGNDGYQDV